MVSIIIHGFCNNHFSFVGRIHSIECIWPDTTNLPGAVFSGSSNWSLPRKPTVGFYLELLHYQKENFPEITTRPLGMLFLNMDPWLSATVKVAVYRYACAANTR